MLNPTARLSASARSVSKIDIVYIFLFLRYLERRLCAHHAANSFLVRDGNVMAALFNGE